MTTQCIFDYHYGILIYTIYICTYRGSKITKPILKQNDLQIGNWDILCVENCLNAAWDQLLPWRLRDCDAGKIHHFIPPGKEMAQLPCISLSWPRTIRHLLGVANHLLSLRCNSRKAPCWKESRRPRYPQRCWRWKLSLSFRRTRCNQVSPDRMWCFNLVLMRK